MLRKTKNGIHWLEFDLLSDVGGLQHGVFLRHGGVSDGHLSSLNVGIKVGDSEHNVKTNINRIRDVLLGPDLPGQIHCAHQVHEANVREIKSGNNREIPTCDALMTREPHQALLIKHADCQVAIFYDPVQHALGMAHAGWRGSVRNIYRETIWQMKEVYGSRPADLLVCISPSLGPQSAEFVNYQTELPESFWEFQVKPFYFDFWSISEWQLKSCGILPHHIEIARIDTFVEREDCFSHRREKITGRHATVAVLK